MHKVINNLEASGFFRYFCENANQAMSFDIARQQFVPALLTTLALAILYVCMIDAQEASVALSSILSHTADAEGLSLEMPAEFLSRFQLNHPAWTDLINILLLLVTGTAIGRLTTRYNLYKVNTCIAIPLFMITASILGVEAGFLPGFVAMMFLALSIKNAARTFRSGYTFDAVFRTTLYLGALILTDPATLPLILLAPIGLFIFRRTLREVAVALVGLITLPLIYSYLTWAMGGEFLAPSITIWQQFIAGTPLTLFHTLGLPQIIIYTFVGLVALCGIQFFLADLYAVGTKPRFILMFNLLTILMTIALLFTPSASNIEWLLVSIPLTIIMPCFLVRISRPLSTTIYFMMMALAIARIVLQ